MEKWESLNIPHKCHSDILYLVLHVYTHTHKHAYHCCSVAKSCPTLCDCVDGNKTASLSSLSQEFAQTQVHWVGDAIQPSHPLSPPSCLQSFPA